METQVDSEKRKHTRFKMRMGVFGLFKSDFQTVGEVLNLSRGGVALKYLNGVRKACERASLDIFMPKQKFYLKNLPVRVVSDFVVPNHTSFTTTVVRRLGARFEDLDAEQSSMIDELIFENTSLREAEP